ncbi:MAG: amino acid ABC transporter ATP-binding protein [Clostridiales bacterium]|nr:amino acid ABC transporter ATP-binding protein [Clostridiales bacterium]
MSILKAENICKSFGNTEVLKNISFTMEKGEALTLIGSSGSGKTTLLRCLNFLETPDSGRITVHGDVLFDSENTGNVSEKELRRRRLHFGMVFQNFNLFPQYTALENVMLARQLIAREQPDFKNNKKAIMEEIESEAHELLKKMGLSNREGNYPHQLSGGQCQRVAIARALAMKPDILCFDEPTSALDPELTGEVLKVIRGLAESDTTMIIVTHEMSFAHDVSDEIIFMDNGYIVEKGTPQQLMDDPQEERTKQFLSHYADTNS